MAHWFLCKYLQDPTLPRVPPAFYPAFALYDEEIQREGGAWKMEHIGTNWCVIKARISDALAQTIGLDINCRRIPMTSLDRPLSDLTNAQRNGLRDLAIEMGYTLAEIRSALGNNLSNVTLRQLLTFLASRRIKARWDRSVSQVVFDGPAVLLAHGLVERLDAMVTD